MNQEQIWQQFRDDKIEESTQRLIKNQDFIDLLKEAHGQNTNYCYELIKNSFVPSDPNQRCSLPNDFLDFDKLLPGSKELAYEIEECAAESVRDTTYVYSYNKMFICYKISYWGMDRPDNQEVCDNTITIHTDISEILNKVKTIKFVTNFFNNLDELYSVKLNRFTSYMNGRFLDNY